VADGFPGSSPDGLPLVSRSYASASPAVSVKTIPEDLLATIVAPEPRAATPLEVARSWRAAWLAGLIVGLLHTGTGLASLAMGHNAAGQGVMGQSVMGMTGALMPSDLSALIGKQAEMQHGLSAAGATILPLLVLGSLWSGARASVFSIFIAHRILQAFEQTAPWAYALAGAATTLVYAFLVHQLRLDDTPPNWLLEASSGIAAGCFYRLFAGTVRR